jgi:hypothetical protein
MPHVADKAAALRAEIVEWAKRWRCEKCSRTPDCNQLRGEHDDACDIERSRIDGIALVDALELAEHDAQAECEA